MAARVLIPAASLTEAPPIVGAEGGLDSPLMAVSAVPRLLCCEQDPCPPDVLGLRDGFEMGRSNTPSLEAEMVDVQSGRDGSDVELIRKAMRKRWLAMYRDHAVTVSAGGSSPDPALINNVVVRTDLFFGSTDATLGGQRVAVTAPPVVVAVTPAETLLGLAAIRDDAGTLCHVGPSSTGLGLAPDVRASRGQLMPQSYIADDSMGVIDVVKGLV